MKDKLAKFPLIISCWPSATKTATSKLNKSYTTLFKSFGIL